MSSPALTREEKLALLAKLAKEKASKPKKAPLSFAQERHYFLTRLDPSSFAHNVFRAFDVAGPLDPAAFAAAVADLLRRHESLRTTFVEEDGRPQQLVAPAAMADDYRLPLEDLRNEPAPAELARAKAAAEARLPFDLQRDLPWRWRLLRTGEESWVLLLSLHHIVADGWSLGILLREVFHAYGERSRGAAPVFAPLPIGFSDFAVWQHQQLDLGAQVAFWKAAVGDAPTVVELPTDFPRPALASLAGDNVPVALGPAASAALRQLARAQGATPFMVLLASFAVLLHRTTGQADLLIGTPVAGRNRKEIEGLIGSFANTLVLRSRYAGGATFAAHLAQVKKSALAAFDHQDLPFERLVEEIHPPRDLSRNPLFQVMFALLDAGGGAPRAAATTEAPAAELEIRPFGVERGLSKVDLTLEMVDGGEQVHGYLEFATDLYERATVERFAAAFVRLTERLVAAPGTPLEQVDLLADDERRQQLEDFQGGPSSAGAQIPLPAAILEQARRTPEAVAVSEPGAYTAGGAAPAGQTFTYGQLDAASARLAVRLRAAGVRRGDRVGLCLERSREAMVAFLAVWRAGAAYVALDPGYPAERLAYLIEDSGLRLLLTQERLRDRLPAGQEALSIDDLLGHASFVEAHHRPDRHPGEGRGPSPGSPSRDADKNWIPASAGMTVGRLAPDQKGERPGTSADPNPSDGAELPSSSPNHAGSLETRDSPDRLPGEGRGPVPSPLPPFEDEPLTGDDLAYVIYTSGSTGKPKGVLVPHRALANHAAAIVGRYQLTPADRVLQFASLSFDLAGEEIYPTWLAGAALVLRAEPQSLAFADFFRLLGDERITVANLPTPYWHEWVAELQEGRLAPPPDLRLVVVGTEQALAERLAGWRRAVGERPRWVNSYGPSEATITATSWDPPAGETPARVSIGTPLAGVRAYVLDAAMEPLPLGLPGELCLGGAGLAHGYHRRPSLTAEKFVPDPHSGVPGARLYRSGDRARLLPDGAIEFLGRLDGQVKVRGFRIEVGEIEAFLADYSSVADAVVLAREVAPGDRRLVAYLAPAGGASAGLEAALRGHLEARLPAYMVPSAFVVLPALPLNRSGKVDRDALRALPLDGLASDETPFEAPRDPLEELVAEVWSGLLGGVRVGVHDDFFRLGGHSLLATRLLARLRALAGVELPLKAVFEAPTLGALAARVAAARAAGRPVAPPIVAAPRGENAELPLSFAQARMWFLAQLDPELPTYNMPNALRLEGELDLATLERALSEIVRRHESLRTTFVAEKGKPRQVIHPPAPYLLPVMEAADETAALARSRETSLLPFDLASDWPLRCELIAIGPRLHWLTVVFHHIASDGWSTDLFLHELQAHYAAFLAGRPAPLPPLPLQYADFAAWQNAVMAGEALQDELAFWKKRLAGAPTVLDLPTDRPRPPVRRHRGGRETFHLSAALGDQLRELSRRQGASLFMTFLAAWAVFLSRLSHQPDVVIGSPVAGRHRPEIERLIGFFANTLVLRLELAGRPSFLEILALARERVLEAYDHQDLPFEKLVDEIQPERASSYSPLFQVTFVLHHASTFRHDGAPAEAAGAAGPAGGLRLSLPSVDNQTARFDLALVLVEQAEGFRGFLEYDADLFDAASVARHAASFVQLLAGIAAAPQAPVAALPLLPEGERARLLEPWPDLVVADPNTTPSLAELFTRAAERFPERPALTCDGVSLGYAELARRSAALARALRERGIGLESRVGIALDRSLDLVVGILGILRAGAAYVPIDPNSPTDRMAYILADSGAQLLLSRGGLELPEAATPRLDIEALDLDAPGELPDSGATGANLAYVIYTSGSTGRPKGVAVTHGNAVRLMTATEAWFAPDETDVWTLFHSSAFDFSVWELWGPLLYGGRLVVVPYFVSRSAEAFYDLLVAEKVTFLNMTPSMFRQVDRVDEERRAAAGASPLQSLRCVVFGGEAVDLQGLAGWWQRHPADAPRLVNMYGITETTVHVTYRPLDPLVLEMPVASVIGRPIPDLSVFLVDRELNLVPAGVPGEICVGGAGLARGYLGRPSLTAQRFVPNPFAATPGERLYRSGDLGRLLATPAGLELDYHGRIDLQVKIRGFRIELGEIEASLTEQEAVHEAIVLAREDEPGNKQLVAYLTLKREARAASSAPSDLVPGWRSALAARLPDYMVPAAFVILDGFPLTVNGKVDRKALPAPEKDRSAVAAAYVAPRSEVEQKIAAVWQEVLGQERVGAFDDFFELGGHSLLATQVMARLRELFDLELPLRLLFEKKTVAALADEIVGREVASADEDLLLRLLAEL